VVREGILVVGRFSGFHRGHVELIRRAHLDHPDMLVVIAVVVGKKSSQDLEKNPFTFEERKEMIERILDRLGIQAGIVQVPSAYIPDLVRVLREEHDIDIKYVYCGADRLSSYLKQDLESMGVSVVYLERDTSAADPTQRASATRVRNAVRSNDYEEFKALMPEEIDDGTLREVFDTLREAMRQKGIALSAFVIEGGIPHIEDLSVEEFIDWVENFYDEKILAVQKLDGTFNLSVLKTEDGIQFARLAKGQAETFTSGDLPKTAVYNALRGACAALETPAVREIFNKYLDVGEAIDVEVLYGDQPNTIRYNLESNYLALLRFISARVGRDTEETLSSLTEELKPLEVRVDNTVYFYNWEAERLDSTVQEEVWKFTKPGILDKLSRRIDFTKDLSTLKDWLESKNQLIPELTNLEVMGVNLSKVKVSDRPLYTEARERALEEAGNLKLNIKNKMVERILKNANFEIGGTNQEGLVLRNLETGKMTKLVDKEAFTKENKASWYYTELATKGVRVGDKYVPGITARYFDFCASTLDIPMLRLREKFWKKLKSGESDVKTNIRDYLVANDVRVSNLGEKLVLMKREAGEAIRSLHDLKDRVLSDGNLTDTVRKRTLNSLGLINDSFKNLVSDLNSMLSSSEFREMSSHDQLTECVFVLLKNFSN